MFRGAAKVTLDDKGRMVMPTRYRPKIIAEAQGKIVVTIDREQCLLIYPLPEWEIVERKLMALPALRPQARRLQRLMVGYATELELDGHFRFLLPPELREVAKIDRAGMLIGQVNRIELWDEARWHEKREEWLKQEWLKSEEAAPDLPSELEGFSL